MLQEQVAKELGATVCTYRNWDKNHSNPSLVFMPKVVQFLRYIPYDTSTDTLGKKIVAYRRLAQAIAAAHEHDVIHRDLKPGNIKITPEGKVKVLDFGLAKAVGGEALDQQSTVTEPGRVIGTPAYMSPEQARGKPTDSETVLCTTSWLNSDLNIVWQLSFVYFLTESDDVFVDSIRSSYVHVCNFQSLLNPQN